MSAPENTGGNVVALFAPPIKADMPAEASPEIQTLMQVAREAYGFVVDLVNLVELADAAEVTGNRAELLEALDAYTDVPRWGGYQVGQVRNAVERREKVLQFAPGGAS